MAREFYDFELQISGSGEGFKTHVLESPAGEATGAFTLDKTFAENQVLKLSRTRGATRSAALSDQRAAAERLGAYLYETVFTGEVGEKLRTSAALAEQKNFGLRLRLRLQNDRDLLNLPWEYLYDTEEGKFLVLSKWTPLVRYPDAPTPTKPLDVQLPLKILVAISNAVPDGAAELDGDHEWELLRDTALGDARRQGMVALERISGSLSEINSALERVDWDVFHYIGHSGFDRTINEGVLWLEGSDKPIQGNDLAQLLGTQRKLGLTVFNSCEGARADSNDPFAGIAQSVLQKGVPAVVAMQFEIRDDAAILFSRAFYTALADGQAVDEAVSSARRAIFGAPNDVEWGTPVLFLRSEDSQIFRTDELTPAIRTQLRDLAVWYQDATERMDQRRWREAAELFQRIVDERPDYLDAEKQLNVASGRSAGDPSSDRGTTKVPNLGDADRHSGDDADDQGTDDQKQRPQIVAIFVAVLIIVIIVLVLIGAVGIP